MIEVKKELNRAVIIYEESLKKSNDENFRFGSLQNTDNCTYLGTGKIEQFSDRTLYEVEMAD